MAIRVPITVDGHLRHSGAVDLLEKHGVPAPADYAALRSRLEAYQHLHRPITDRLQAALLDVDSTEDLAVLRALSAAEQAETAPDEQMLRAGWDKLKTLYDGHAAYRVVAARWDEVAAEFTASVQTVDPTAPADQVIDLPAATQKAWRKGQELGAQLDDLAVLVQTAAQLTGIVNPATNTESVSSPIWQAANKSMCIGLVCDASDLHRRRVWEAFDQGWAALVLLGVTLRAADLALFEPYAKPKALVERKIQRSDGTYAFVQLDPEDDDFVPAPVATDIAFPQQAR